MVALMRAINNLTSCAKLRGKRYDYDFCFYLILLFIGSFDSMVT